MASEQDVISWRGTSWQCSVRAERVPTGTRTKTSSRLKPLPILTVLILAIMSLSSPAIRPACSIIHRVCAQQSEMLRIRDVQERALTPLGCLGLEDGLSASAIRFKRRIRRQIVPGLFINIMFGSRAPIFRFCGRSYDAAWTLPHECGLQGTAQRVD
ncbi:hypothetical protein HDK77DRAFT_285733 [Phyllosticta capitalensis]